MVNTMETIPSEKTPQKPDFSLRTWEDLLSSPQRLQLLLIIGSGYNIRFEHLKHRLRMLRQLRPFTYLIDFDVLSRLISVDEDDDSADAKLAGYRVYSWFHLGSQCYGLPWGAFQELLHYLRRLRRLDTIDFRRHPCDSLQTVQVIANALDIQLEEGATLEEISVSIVEAMHNTTLRLGRLRDFLLNSRFRGVFADYDDSVAESLNDWISLCPRAHSRHRDDRDRHDSENLAIAVKSMCGSDSLDEPNGLVLVTTTGFLLDLFQPASLLEVDDERSGAAERAPRRGGACLSRLEKKKLLTRIFSACGHDESQATLPSSFLPVIHPRDATNAELLGFFDNPSNAISNIRERQTELQRITEYCENVLDAPPRSETSDGVWSVITESRGKVLSLLQDFGKRFVNTSELTSLYRLEDYRSAETTAINRLVVDDDKLVFPTHDSSLDIASTKFMKMISEVEWSMTGLLDYTGEIEVYDTVPPFARLKVCEKETGGASLVNIVTGECFAAESVGDEGLVVLRWATYCCLDEFYNAVEKYLESIGIFYSLAGTECVEVSSTDPCWKRGVVLYTDGSSIGCAFSIQPASNQADGRLDEMISHVLRATRVGRQLHDVEVPVTPIVKTIRINTDAGDFAFDLEALDHEVHRFCTFLSHRIMYGPLATLIGMLSTRFIQGSNLGRVIKETIADARSQFACRHTVLDENHNREQNVC